MAIDRTDWHTYGGNFPKDLPPENGGTHIGMFLAWIIGNDLVGEMHLEDAIDSLNAVKARKITGRDFLIKECDDKFWDEDLNEEGLAFTRFYYADEEGMRQYIADYENAFKESRDVYLVEDNWDNYDRISKVIDARFAEWKSLNS